MSGLEGRVALEQRVLEALWTALAAVDEAVPALRRLEDDERLSALLAVARSIDDLTEGVEGWTGCGTCERVVVPIVEGIADVDCEDCEV